MFDQDYIKKLIKQKIDEIYDSLNRFLTILLGILIILGFFIKNFFLDLSKVLILVLIIYRLFSKNRLQRQKENEIFNKIIHPFSHIKTSKNSNIKKNIFKKCKKCGTILKLPLPKKRGIQHAKCPECQNRVTFFTLKQQKIEKVEVEVIKKKKGK